MNFSYDRFGAGEPLLLIQGMSGHRRIWGEPFLNALAQDFDVVAYDHRGIGDSDRAEGQFTIGDLAHDAADLLDQLGWDSAHIVGISMGGMVSQELALHFPKRVRSLTLGCTTSGGPGADLNGAGLMRMVQAMSQGKDAALRAAYEANLSPDYTADPANYDPYLEVALSVRVPAPVIQLQLMAAAQFDASTRLVELKMPVLIIHGTADEMIPVSNAHRLAEQIPEAVLELLDGAPHLFWWEHPDKSADLIRKHALG